MIQSSLAMKYPLGENGATYQVQRFLKRTKAKFNTRLNWQNHGHESLLSNLLQKWPGAIPHLLLCGLLSSDCTSSLNSILGAECHPLFPVLQCLRLDCASFPHERYQSLWRLLIVSSSSFMSYLYLTVLCKRPVESSLPGG